MSGAAPVTKLPSNVLTPVEAQGLRRRLVEGTPLTIPQSLELLSSHEHVRAHALAAKNRVRMLEAEVADLLIAIRRRANTEKMER